MPASTSAPEAPSILAAIDQGERAMLVALRANIAGRLDAGVSDRDLASLSKRLMDLDREIKALDESEEGDVAEAARAEDEPL